MALQPVQSFLSSIRRELGPLSTAKPAPGEPAAAGATAEAGTVGTAPPPGQGRAQQLNAAPGNQTPPAPPAQVALSAAAVTHEAQAALLAQVEKLMQLSLGAADATGAMEGKEFKALMAQLARLAGVPTDAVRLASGEEAPASNGATKPGTTAGGGNLPLPALAGRLLQLVQTGGEATLERFSAMVRLLSWSPAAGEAPAHAGAGNAAAPALGVQEDGAVPRLGVLLAALPADTLAALPALARQLGVKLPPPLLAALASLTAEVTVERPGATPLHEPAEAVVTAKTIVDSLLNLGSPRKVNAHQILRGEEIRSSLGMISALLEDLEPLPKVRHVPAGEKKPGGSPAPASPVGVEQGPSPSSVLTRMEPGQPGATAMAERLGMLLKLVRALPGEALGESGAPERVQVGLAQVIRALREPVVGDHARPGALKPQTAKVPEWVARAVAGGVVIEFAGPAGPRLTPLLDRLAVMGVAVERLESPDRPGGKIRVKAPGLKGTTREAVDLTPGHARTEAERAPQNTPGRPAGQAASSPTVSGPGPAPAEAARLEAAAGPSGALISALSGGEDERGRGELVAGEGAAGHVRPESYLHPEAFWRAAQVNPAMVRMVEHFAVRRESLIAGEAAKAVAEVLPDRRRLLTYTPVEVLAPETGERGGAQEIQFGPVAEDELISDAEPVR